MPGESYNNGHILISGAIHSEAKNEHKLPCKVLCSHCHSPIADEGRKMFLLFPETIDSDGSDKQAILCE